MANQVMILILSSANVVDIVLWGEVVGT